MTVEEICDIPVKNIANDDCILFMWATFPKIEEALNVIKAWGFKYKSGGFIWLKINKNKKTPSYGLGRWTRGNIEPCLFATREGSEMCPEDIVDVEPCLLATKGKPKRDCAGVFQLIVAPSMGHSAKPPETRDKIVKLMGSLPRVELFAREQADGWDAIGNEIDGRDIREVIK